MTTHAAVAPHKAEEENGRKPVQQSLRSRDVDIGASAIRAILQRLFVACCCRTHFRLHSVVLAREMLTDSEHIADLLCTVRSYTWAITLAALREPAVVGR